MEEDFKMTPIYQCLPISCLELFKGQVVCAGEGPCLLIGYPQSKSENVYLEPLGRNKERLRRFQIFPNQLTITGMAFKEEGVEDCDDVLSTGFLWAGNHGTLVKINRNSLEVEKFSCYPLNMEKLCSYDYIPISAKWLFGGRTLAVLSVFNSLILYEHEKGELQRLQSYQCDKENLYSGHIHGKSLKDLVLFSGTTFKGIIVWTIENDSAVVKHRLFGHKGLPFSLQYNSGLSFLASSSDDRTVIVWAFYNSSSDDTKSRLIPDSVKIRNTFRGHEARVWKAIWTKVSETETYLVSVGEDAVIQVYPISDTDSSPISFKGHNSASIYHCVYNSLCDILVTAANDGSIYKWTNFYERKEANFLNYDYITSHPYTDHLNKLNKHGRAIGNNDYPRNVCVWSPTSLYVVAAMDSGRIIALDTVTKKQYDFFYSKELERYSVLGVSNQHTFLSIGGIKGEFNLLQFDSSINETSSTSFAVRHIWRHNFEEKILHIHWLTQDTRPLVLIVCLQNAYIWKFDWNKSTSDKMVKLEATSYASFPLDLGRPGVPAALFLDKDTLLLGDEVGSLLVFSWRNQTFSLVFKFANMHREGVTKLVEYNSKILSSGRHGGIKMFKLDNMKQLELLHEFHPPFEWVATILPLECYCYKDLLISGFYKGKLVVYSWEQKRILREILNLGGGHRRWDANFNDEQFCLAYLRDKELYYSSLHIYKYLDAGLKFGLHGKTVNCGVIFGKRDNLLHLASGSEDGSIILIDNCLQQTHVADVFNFHASSVKTLRALSTQDNKIVLFSGGGRSQVFVTQLNPQKMETRSLARLTLVFPPKSISDMEIDVRVMDLCPFILKEKTFCLCCCSDGKIRVVSFSPCFKKFEILYNFCGNGHALTNVTCIHDNESNCDITVLATSSNGKLLTWYLNKNQLINSELNFPEGAFSSCFQLCKCSIMSMKISQTNSTNYVIAIGGDDCSVSLFDFVLSEGSSAKVSLRWTQNQTQRGAVVGVHIVPRFIVSCSNDQIIAIWNRETGQLVSRTHTPVTDCQGFLLEPDLDDSTYATLVVFGNGLSCSRIQLKESAL